MYKSSCRLRGALPVLALFAVALTAAGSVQAKGSSPCTKVADSCTEWVALGHGSARSLIYTTYRLDVPNPRIRRALVMVHGTLRNPDHYFKTATGAGFLAGALNDTVIIAPAFHSDQGKYCQDHLQPGEVSWSCGGDSWRSGGTAASDPTLTSFDFMDQILRRLANRKIFPNLAVIVVAGHSAGGQFISRYEMANRVGEKLGVPVRYVVANPSSYAWPDATRALHVGDGMPANEVAGWNKEDPHTDFSYGPFDATKAPTYDKWPYGLEQRTSGYTAKMSDAQLKQQLASRTTFYLLSQVDTLPLGGFDGSPNAMAQGATRRSRGEAFVKYLREHMGATHSNILIVPECGHNDRCVYTTDDVLKVIFPAVG